MNRPGTAKILKRGKERRMQEIGKLVESRHMANRAAVSRRTCLHLEDRKTAKRERQYQAVDCPLASKLEVYELKDVTDRYENSFSIKISPFAAPLAVDLALGSGDGGADKPMYSVMRNEAKREVSVATKEGGESSTTSMYALCNHGVSNGMPQIALHTFGSDSWLV